MSEPNEALSPDAEEALKKRLLTRIAIAGGAVVVLLGGLAVFDAVFVSPPSPREVARVSEQAEEPKESKESKEAKAAESVPAATEPAPLAQQEAAPQVPAAVPEPPTFTPEGSSSVTTRPAPTASARPLTPPATARPAMIKPPEPLAAARPGPGPGREAVRPPPPSTATLSRPLSQALESARQFVVQMGVFSSAANAEELRAKLELNGIPAQIESRVQVGPFLTRVEAEAARDRLRAIGMEPGILTAVRK